MKLAWITVGSALAIACSSSSSGRTAGAGQDRGLEGEGAGAAAAADKNPDGAAYPTDNLGTNARQGERRGNTIANYKFLGYPDGTPGAGLQPVSLADYFDPTGARYKLIHIQASGTWCRFCKEEIGTVAPIAAKIADRKVVWLVSLAEGKVQGTPANEADLKAWVSQFKTPFPHLLDPGNQNLGPFYDAAALPWNANIDARTMEILSTGVGAQDHLTEADALADLDKWLDKMN